MVGKEFNPVMGFYPNGTIRMKGTCRIEGSGPHQIPLIDVVEEAVFYRPDGSVASTIIDGIGSWRTFYPSGQLAWEMKYANHEKLSWKHWGENGELLGGYPNKSGQ